MPLPPHEASGLQAEALASRRSAWFGFAPNSSGVTKKENKMQNKSRVLCSFEWKIFENVLLPPGPAECAERFGNEILE